MFLQNENYVTVLLIISNLRVWVYSVYRLGEFANTATIEQILQISSDNKKIEIFYQYVIQKEIRSIAKFSALLRLLWGTVE